MKIKENITVFIFDHCKKRMFIKSAMEKHERLCYTNPDNKRACSDCTHLKEIEIDYYYQSRYNPDGGDQRGVCKGFFCEKLNKKLYPFKVEKKDLPNKYPETFEDQEPMPKECEHYKFFI